MNKSHLALVVHLALAGFGPVACGGQLSTLHTLGHPTGQGAPRFEVENATDVFIHQLFVAKTETVNAAHVAPGSTEDQALWGPDLIDRPLKPGARAQLPDVGPGRWDVLVLDADRREQRVTGLKIQAGGRYVLEIHEGSWRAPR